MTEGEGETRQGVRSTFKDFGKGAKRYSTNQKEIYICLFCFYDDNDWNIFNLNTDDKGCFPHVREEQGKAWVQRQWWQVETIPIRDVYFLCAGGSQIIC